MTITTYTDREIALRQQLAAATQLAQLNGEIAAELKADKLALEEAIESSRKQEVVAWLITAAGTKRQEVQLCKPYRLLTSERVRPLFAAPVVAPDVKQYGDDRAREALEMAAKVCDAKADRVNSTWIPHECASQIRALAKEIK